MRAGIIGIIGWAVLLLYGTPLSAQNKRDVRDIIMSGNEYYFNEQYSKALEFYYKVLSKDSLNIYANFHAAECQRKIFNFTDAEKYYKVVVNHAAKDYPLAKFYYPQMQKFNGKFKEAINNFNGFINFTKQNEFEGKEEFLEKAIIERKGCYFAISHLENPFGEYHFTALPSPVNSSFNDYGPYILDNDSSIVLTSGRSTVTGKVMNNRYGEYYSDNFRFQQDSLGWVALPNDDNFQITNTDLGEGAGSFCMATSSFYFTGCYEDGPYCKIYVSTKKEGKWQAPKPMDAPINLKDTDNKQPSVTKGGDTLFFVSNRTGGLGGNDIWMTKKEENGAWGMPINLGKKINTPYNEVSPYFYKTDNILFFSSDGHEGLGGLDVFLARGGIGTFTSVENIGFPFNSNHDDGYLVLGEKKGYLASNRKEGQGNFDVYQFDIVTKQSIIADVDKIDKKKETILSSRVLNRNGNAVYVMREDDQFFYANIKSDDKPILDRIVAAKLKNYAVNSALILSDEDQAFYDALSPSEKSRLDRMTQVLYMEGKHDLGQYLSSIPKSSSSYSYLTISGKLFEVKTDQPAFDIQIPLVDEEGNTVKTTTTSKDGTFKYINLPLNRKYKILAENIPKKITDSARFFIRNIQLKEEVKRPADVQFESVYFDLNKYDLRPEGKKALDEIITYYQSFPDIQIEIFAYTDTTGSDEYNYLLSKERGKSAYNYLLSGGIDGSALVIEAQGKDITALTDNDQLNRQLKRRVEFNIVGAAHGYEPAVRTYIVRKKISLEEIAKNTGNTTQELMALNGIKNEVVQAFVPIRIKTVQDLKIPEFLFRLPE